MTNDFTLSTNMLLKKKKKNPSFDKLSSSFDLHISLLY